MIIAASFIVSIPLGIATATAVIFHEIPHEIGNFASLLYGGFSVKKALLYNFFSALAALLGALLVLTISTDVNPTSFLIPFAAGGFIYVAGTDLIPELHKHNEAKKGVIQVLAFLVGIGLMLGILLAE
jgi:zinc and cadmium transporter